MDDAGAFLTVKAELQGPVRAEFEYPIPVGDTLELLAHRTGRLVEKHRQRLAAPGAGEWVVDEHTGTHRGLIVLEIEWAEAEDACPDLPGWVAGDVTGERAYSNARRRNDLRLRAGRRPRTGRGAHTWSTGVRHRWGGRGVLPVPCGGGAASSARRRRGAGCVRQRRRDARRPCG